MLLTECSKTKELIDEISSIRKSISIYSYKQNNLQASVKAINDDVEVLKQRKQLIESAKQYYLKVVDLCYMHSIKEMEDFVNHVLGYVFYDELYRIKLDITNKHNKSITFYLIDEKKDLELPLRKGNGKGVKAVVSFILLTYYLLRMKSPYLFLDESFVNISAGYVERFFEYVKLLCNKHQMCVVLITHDPRFVEFADEIYEVKKGVVTKCV
jgi:DNA repair exonuclease SbcCD ATPase subunit